MSAALLEAEGLRTGYGRLPVVFDVDLEIGEGEIVALLGANGAGKTTTLRALSGMLPLMDGDVRLDGTSLKGRAPNAIARGGIVHVPQGRGIFPTLKVDETLRLACAMAGIRRGEIDARVDDIYAIFTRLHERRDQFAGTLSGGEQQMLAIARGLIMKPRLLLIDEMSQGLAPTIVQALFDIVRALPEQGVSVLIVEQFVTHALAVASRAYVLDAYRALNEQAIAGEKITNQQRLMTRGVTCFAILQAREVVDFAYHAAGSNAIFEKNPFERRFRDLHTVTQQAQAHSANFEALGQALLGMTGLRKL